MSKIDLTFRRFSASDVESITGLSNAMQRDYRRKGFLPPIEGHGRFDAVEVCQMWSIKLLADRGIGPTHTRSAAILCSYAIVSRALQSPDAYEPAGDQETTAMITAEQLEAFRVAALSRDASLLPHNSARFIMSAPRYFAWFSDDEITWGDRLDPMFEGRSAAKANRPVVVLDLHRQATDLLRQAGTLVEVAGTVRRRRRQEA